MYIYTTKISKSPIITSSKEVMLQPSLALRVWEGTWIILFANHVLQYKQIFS